MLNIDWLFLLDALQREKNVRFFFFSQRLTRQLLCSQVVEILQKLYACGADDLGLNFINELTVRFCHCPKWVGRQAFAFICQVGNAYLKCPSSLGFKCL